MTHYSPKKIFVYIVEAENGVVKIGASVNPASRANLICQHSPVPVRLVAQWPGTFADERLLHHRFEAHRGHNEWFRMEGALRDFVLARWGEDLASPPPPFDALRFASRKSSAADRSKKMSENMKALWSNPEKRRSWLESIQRGRENRRLSLARKSQAAA